MKLKHAFPSHGIPSGGTALLERTLQHRLKREVQILALHLQAALETEILENLYPQLELKYQGFARQTIRQHLRKIEQEMLWLLPLLATFIKFMLKVDRVITRE